MASDPTQQWLRDKVRHIAFETAELPGLRLLGQPLYDRLFARSHKRGNLYRGVYASFDEAQRAAPAQLPTSYDIAPAVDMYGERAAHIIVSDYPAVYWLQRLFAQGAASVFDLGGHLGISFRGFRHWLDYPATLRWNVHDVPAVVSAGRAMVAEHADLQALAFADAPADAEGYDILFAAGSLQYLDYALPELLATLAQPPRHVLINLTPMHPRLSYFTLQNMGKAVLPYRVSCRAAFVAEMGALGYRMLDQWCSHERSLRVPFAPAHTVDGYSGFCFAREIS